MKRSRWITLAVVAAVIALFFYMSTARANQECTVCVEFQGRSNCATAAGATAAEATETAHSTACGPVARGMNETLARGNRAPVSRQCGRRREWAIFCYPAAPVPRPCYLRGGAAAPA